MFAEFWSEIVLFFFIAVVYSSAGFGGGSMYLAVLAGSGMGQTFTRMAALVCNALVTANTTLQFKRSGWLASKPVVQLLLCSVPFCIWSSALKLESHIYFILCGTCLLLAGFAMMLRKQSTNMKSEPPVNAWWHYLLSAVCGLLAGLTGIGGGVYLSPLLHLSNWGNAKQIAAASSAFILINSLSAIITGFIADSVIFEPAYLWLALSVTAGSSIGSLMSSKLFSQQLVKWITTIVIIFVALRILTKHL